MGARTGGRFAAGRRGGVRPSGRMRDDARDGLKLTRPGVSAVASLVVVALLVAGCGGGGSSTESNSKPTTLNATFAAFPDYMDPALSYSLEGWTSMWETYVPLLTYRHAGGAAGAQLIPGLARAMPRITDGGKTYTLYLRKGLRYSDGTPVRASDFGATIERDLVMNSPGSPFFTDIVGAEKFAETKKGKIGGIEADDASGRIVIHLVQPRGTFSNELAMLFAAPLPAGTKHKDLSGEPPPGTGPYEIAAAKPGRDWEYVRNPEWATHDEALLPQIPSGNYDSIDVEVIANPETAVNDVERGKLAWMEEPAPPDRFAE